MSKRFWFLIIVMGMYQCLRNGQKAAKDKQHGKQKIFHKAKMGALFNLGVIMSQLINQRF